MQYLIEGITKDIIAYLMEDYGYSYSELLDKLIEIADEN